MSRDIGGYPVGGQWARFPWRPESPLSLVKLRGSLTIATTKTTRPLTTIYTLLGFNGYSSVQNRS